MPAMSILACKPKTLAVIQGGYVSMSTSTPGRGYERCRPSLFCTLLFASRLANSRESNSKTSNN